MHWDYAHSFHPLRFFIKPDSVLRPYSTICKVDSFSCWKLDETDKWLSRKYSFLLEVTQGKNMPINCGWVGLSSYRWKCTYTYQCLTEKDTITVWPPSVNIFQHTGAGRTIAAYVFVFLFLIWSQWLGFFPRGFLAGSVVRNLPANTGDASLILDPGRSHMLRSSWAHESHSYWTCAREPGSYRYWAGELQLLKPGCPRAQAP